MLRAGRAAEAMPFHRRCYKLRSRQIRHLDSIAKHVAFLSLTDNLPRAVRLFEKHLAEGPYVTIDDVVDDRYKRHPGVQHIPGHPVCDQMYKELIRALGVKLPATGAMALMKAFTNLRSELKY